MRIGIDCRLWNESGVGRYTRNLIGQLLIIDKKNSYTLFALPKDIEIINYQLSIVKRNYNSEIKNLKLKIADVRWHTIEEQLKLASILKKENLDIVHFPYFSVPIFYNRPFVVTIHDLILHHFPTGEASTLPHFLYRMKLLGYKIAISNAANRAKKIITVSNATKSEIVDHLKIDPSKIVVAHEGASLKDSLDNNFSTKIDTGDTKSLLNDKNYFLYVGNAYPHKNLDRLIESFEKIHSKYSNTVLVFVGKEDFFYKRLKEKVFKKGLEKSIVFYGEANDNELSILYKNALALVMPSLMEGFGLPVLEAMSRNCLVVLSKIDSLKEICSDAGVYFDPYSADDISEKLEKVLKGGRRHFNNKIKIGKELSNNFSWKKMALETLKNYYT